MSWSNKRSVLVPFDFSDACKEAVRVAREFVEDDAAITLLHVVTLPSANSPGVVWGTVTPQSLRSRSTKAMREVLDELGIAANAVAVVGSPPEAITEYAEHEGVELIVLPSHGRTGVSRVFLGSVAERVVRFAGVPVLVLRRDESDS